MTRFFPFLAWLPLLKNQATLRSDILAGLTGAIVVLPQGVALDRKSVVRDRVLASV